MVRLLQSTRITFFVALLCCQEGSRQSNPQTICGQEQGRTAETSLHMADPWQNWNPEPEVPQPGCPHHPQEEVWHRTGYCDLCVWALEVLETWPNGESRDIPPEIYLALKSFWILNGKQSSNRRF